MIKYFKQEKFLVFVAERKNHQYHPLQEDDPRGENWIPKFTVSKKFIFFV